MSHFRDIAHRCGLAGSRRCVGNGIGDMFIIVMGLSGADIKRWLILMMIVLIMTVFVVMLIIMMVMFVVVRVGRTGIGDDFLDVIIMIVMVVIIMWRVSLILGMSLIAGADRVR